MLRHQILIGIIKEFSDQEGNIGNLCKQLNTQIIANNIWCDSVLLDKIEEIMISNNLEKYEDEMIEIIRIFNLVCKKAYIENN